MQDACLELLDAVGADGLELGREDHTVGVLGDESVRGEHVELSLLAGDADLDQEVAVAGGHVTGAGVDGHRPGRACL